MAYYEGAYAAIPHQRRVFDYSQSQIPQNEAKYLKELFEITDLAVVEHIETLVWLQTGGKRCSSRDDYSPLVRRLNTMRPPHKLRNTHTLVLQDINM